MNGSSKERNAQKCCAKNREEPTKNSNSKLISKRIKSETHSQNIQKRNETLHTDYSHGETKEKERKCIYQLGEEKKEAKHTPNEMKSNSLPPCKNSTIKFGIKQNQNKTRIEQNH